MTTIICISAGQLSTKKANTIINKRNRYLNYGLLSLATRLKSDGLDSIVIHGNFDTPLDTLRTALSYGLSGESPVLISLPSFYAVSWAKEFMEHSKELFPLMRFIVGGRWVVGDRPEKLQSLLPLANQIVPGVAEHLIVSLVKAHISGVHIHSSGFPSQSYQNFLDYRLLHNRKLYQPAIEVSRGCGMGCSFCQERSEKLQPLKPAEHLVHELQQTLQHDELGSMTPYFEASMFVPTAPWVNDFNQHLNQQELAVKWRTEGRVDNIRPELIPLLAKAGLTVLDLGLESASPLQLKRMKKTRHPDKYLARAASLLEACADSGVKVKVNLLLFAGEEESTIERSISWLDRHQELFHGVSAGQVIGYGWDEDIRPYLNEMATYGASIHSTPITGVCHLNLSDSYDYPESVKLSREISKRYMSASDYYYLKSFSYFARDYTYRDFLIDVDQTAKDKLTFRVSESEKIAKPV